MSSPPRKRKKFNFYRPFHLNNFESDEEDSLPPVAVPMRQRPNFNIYNFANNYDDSDSPHIGLGVTTRRQAQREARQQRIEAQVAPSQEDNIRNESPVPGPSGLQQNSPIRADESPIPTQANVDQY